MSHAQSMGVHFNEGSHYILVIDTDAYSGNFERELCGYATGICDEERVHGMDQAADARQANEDMVDRLVYKAVSLSHNKYGYVSNAIRTSPNGGYNSVGIFFSEPLDAEELDFVRQRVAQFPAKTSVGGRPAFNVHDVYMVEVRVARIEESRIEALPSTTPTTPG